MNKGTFRIGISGHQQLGDETTVQFVSQQLRELLITYREQAYQQGKDIVAHSALALGADQLFIRTASELGIPVEVIIPCAKYGEIFPSREARDEYHRLLRCSRNVHRLPFEDCSEDAYLAAGHWIVDQSDLVILVWNGYPAAGKGGTADIASYSRLVGRPFVHVHTRLHTVKQYGSLTGCKVVHETAKRTYAVSKETVLLVEEYDLGAENWQLTIPGGKVTDPTLDGIRKQAEIELREEMGYRPGRLEKFLDFYGHPRYIAHMSSSLQLFSFKLKGHARNNLLFNGTKLSSFLSAQRWSETYQQLQPAAGRA